MTESDAPLGELYVSRHEPMLGTRVELRLRATSAESAATARAAVLDEIERLEQVFSQYRPDSQFNQWRRAEVQPGPELARLLAWSLHWQRIGAGAYNPAVDVLTERWRRAETDGEVPSRAELGRLAATIQEPPYSVQGDEIVVGGDLANLSFNAFAKGHIADLAAMVALDLEGVVGVTVNAGGDLAHRGPVPLAVGIEDPRRPYDNVAPLTVVELRAGGLATSGSARRGHRVAGKWFGHVIDPRDGHPVDRTASVSVIAPDAATADVVATIAGVLEPDAALEFVAGLEAVGCCIVQSDRSVHTEERWRAAERPRPGAIRPG